MVRGGGRGATWDKYLTAVRKPAPGELPLLLVDSEEIPVPGHSTWQHLKARDKWNRPEGAGSQDAFLMICCMETWFLADQKSMRDFFGASFKVTAIPKWPDFESVPKATVFDALERATTGKYSKGKVSFELLAAIEPGRVEEHCAAAKSLLDRLRAVRH